MRFLYIGLLAAILARSRTAMDAAQDACRLFVGSVLPGLFPYMVVTRMLVSRCGGRLPVWSAVLLGWCGGSPTGASLADASARSGRTRVFLLLSTATMSPMFLSGTVGAWLNSAKSGGIVLICALVSGLIVGLLASRTVPDAPLAADSSNMKPLAFAEAIDRAVRTMLLVCGTMVMWRVFASLLTGVLPDSALLPLITLLEVTTGTAQIAQLPCPLAIRTALLAAATGFGGLAILMQNRAVSQLPLPMGTQLFWQAVHGVISGLLALGLLALWGET